MGGGGAGGGGAAPHPFVPGSHLLMSNSQPAPTVPNISTQTIGAPTSLGKVLLYLDELSRNHSIFRSHSVTPSLSNRNHF